MKRALLALYLTDTASAVLPQERRTAWSATTTSLEQAAAVEESLRAMFIDDPAYRTLSAVPWVLGPPGGTFVSPAT